MGLDETFLSLRPKYPNLSENQLASSLDRVHRSLNPQQLQLIHSKHPNIVPLDQPVRGPILQIADDRPSPEMIVVTRERQEALEKALSQLPPSDQIILRLRYEHDLTLDQIAKLKGFESAQATDREIRKILTRLREHMTTNMAIRPVRKRDAKSV
jgi:RNA polymerase sigma factor (sigma-70 family)